MKKLVTIFWMRCSIFIGWTPKLDSRFESNLNVITCFDGVHIFSSYEGY